VVCRFACLSVYLSVDHVCEPCKTTEPIKMQFGLGVYSDGPVSQVRFRSMQGRGTFWGLSGTGV